jgi:NIPSNAP
MAALGVIELRQYQLHPGRRDELIDLFDDHLLEPQEKCGMWVLGQFRDLDRPDWFVWLRGFADMARRTAALGEFYYGPVWSQHRAAANATMVDSDDVLLLRPAPSHDPRWEPGHEIGLVEIAVRPTGRRDEERELARVAEEVMPAVGRVGGSPLAVLVTEPAANGFPALPVREGEWVVATVAGFDDAAHHSHNRDLAGRPDRGTQLLRLAPTARSRVGRAT